MLICNFNIEGPEKNFALAYDDILAMYQLYSKSSILH